MAIFQKRGKWYIDYYAEGRRIRESAGASRREAARALAARRGEIVQGRFKLAGVKRSPLFEEAAAEYLAWARANLRAWRRQERALARLRHFFAGRRLRDITAWLIERYKQERLKAMVRGRPIRPTTVNRELACLKRLFTLAIAWGKAESNPVRGVKFFREDGRCERILTPAEIEHLLAACRAPLRPMVVLALHTGMRRGEILGLTWERVEIERGVVTLRRTKSGTERRVPLNADAVEALRGQPRAGAYVFGGEAPYRDNKNGWRSARRRAGLSGVRFHDLRHTWASALVAAGVDLRTVQELGGWCSLAMVERYSHPTPEAKRRAVTALEVAFAARTRHQTDTTAPVAVAARAVSTRS